MVGCRSLLVGVLAFCVLLLAPAWGAAADWDRFPTLEPRERVAIKKRFDGPRYNDLRTCYRRMDSRVGAKYFAAMVDVTSETGSRSRKENDAQPFAAALAEAWLEDGTLDADRHILIALGVRNRSVGIHPGEEWERLGFRGEVIEETIEASHFNKHLRRRNYSDALCSLATAVDHRLASLEQENAKQVALLQQRLPSLEERLGGLQERVEERFDDEHPFGKELRASLAAAQTKLEDANAGLEDSPTESVRLADEVDEILEEVPSELDIFDADMARLDEVTEDLAALEATIEGRPDADWEQPQAALSKLSECREKASQIRQDYEGKPWQVRDCQRDAEMHLGRADVHYFYLRTVLPTLAAVLAGALLIWFVAARRSRRRRALGLLEADLDEWQRRLDEAAGRLHGLEVRYPTFFAGHRTPADDQLSELDGRVADAANRISLLHARGCELLEEATRLRKKSHPLDVRRVETALRLLRQTEVDFAAGQIDPNQRLAVPLGESYAGTANQLLGDLEVFCQQARAALEEASEVADRLDEQSGRAGAAATLATGAVAIRRELGLPPDHLDEPLQEAMSRFEQARRLASSSPAAAADLFEEVADKLQEIGERAETGNRVIQRIQGPLTELRETVDHKVRQLRFAGVAVDKLSIDPQHELDAGEHEEKRILGLVAQAREDEADQALEDLQAIFERLEHQLDVAKEARDEVPEMIEELGARGKAVKDRLMEVRYGLKRLAPDHNPEAFEAVSKRLGKFHSRLHRLSKQLGEVKKDHAKKHYLLASERLDGLSRLVERAEQVLGEFADIEQQVERAHGQAEQLLPECERLVHNLQARADGAGVSATLREFSADQYVSLQMARDQIDAEQASWLEVRDRLVSMHKAMTFLDEEVRADLGAYEQARQLSSRLEAELTELQRAGQIPAEAQRALAQIRKLVAGWRAQVEEGSSGGRALLRTGREVAKAVGRADQVADGRTPSQSASALIAYARARLKEVHDKSYGFGVQTDCSGFAPELEQAVAASEAGDFGQALELVEGAIEQIDLEDARADADSEREYRKASIRHFDFAASAPDLRLPGQLGNKSS
ncbi:MAG: hypothetical protein ACLFVJ_17815, partial [Persicimonas sp.]